MAGSSLGRHKMNRRTSPIRSLPIETSENESTAKVFSKAFHAAKKEDGDNFMRSITIKPGDDIVSGAPHYMVGRPWMLSFLSFLKTEDESSRPGKITNATLLIPSCSAVNTDDNTEGMSSSEQSTDSNGGYVVVSSLSKDLTVKNRNTVGGSDEGSNSWVEITRQNVDEKTVEHLVMRPEMKIDNDFVLVGKGLWTLLSSKFGFDFAITHLPRIFSETEGQASFQNSPMVVVYPDLLSDSLATCAIVPIPEGGIFDYNDPSDTDLVSEDETPQDDLFPMDDDFEDSTTNSSPPILLLPPSTTGQDTSHDENMGSNNLMMTDKDEASNNPKKRKRFGAGLGNLGNTCFMNSTLQCLAHTGPIRQYFLSGEYLNDLNKDNPLGTGGELASEFATLLSQMWGTGKSNDSGSNCGTRNSYSSYSSNSYGSSGSVVYPRSFKTTLGKHAEQFVGYSQHDSQELATYLLDALHEDTNRVLKKPYVENPEQGEDEVDEQAAEKAWGLHLKREDSRVLESFMGQVKSRVECPRESCGRVSTTFDPFMYLSVPLPGASERIMDITYVPYGSHERRKRLKVAVTKTGTIADLRHKIVDAINTESAGNYVVNASNIVLTDIWNKEVFSYYNNEDEIDKIRDNDTTSAFEVTSIASIRAHRIEIERQEKDNEANINCREISCDEDILDLATITKLNTDHVWRATLEKYAVQTLSLTTLLNRRRGTHVDRMEFQKKANDFLLQCYSSVEFRAHSSGDEVESTEDRLISEENNRDTDIDLELNQEVENDTTVTQAPISASSSASLNENNQLSLAMLCDNSETFQDVKTMTDVATFEICCDKFYEFSSLEQKQKYDKFCDGIDIQVIVKKPTRHYTAMQEKLLGSALMIRIPPRATVFELRTILSERLSSLLLTKLSTVVDENPNEAIAMDNEKESQDVELAPSSLHGSDEDKKSEKVEVDFIGSEEDKKSEKIEVEFVESPSLDEANILRRCPLSYERKTPYQGSYSKNCAYRQLGSIPKADGDKPSHIARPDNDAEQETILDIVGYRGKVNIHVPQDFVDLFNEEEWDSTDDISSGNNEESSETIAKSPSVLDCISKYCQTEQLEESEMWYCNKCKDHVRAWKQFHLYRAPPILIVHLKRFQYSASTHRRDKIDTFIDFPLSGLDLQKEVLHWSNGEEPIYDCYAVSNHYGGLGGGHYTAYAQNDDGEWCYFDDSRVTTLVKENEVISAAAYVLYYRRRDVKVENEAWRNRALPRVSLDMYEQNLSKKMDVEESGAACDSEEGRMSTGTSDEDMEQSTLNVSCEKVV